jgi:hypothetical protein
MTFWLEVLKLLVPFLFAIALVWIKELVLARRERRALMDLLWRETGREMNNLTGNLNMLAQIPLKFTAERFCVFVAQMPDTAINAAARLAQLDPRNTFTYSSYISTSRHLEASSRTMADLLSKSFTLDAAQFARLESAVTKLARGLQRDILKFAECNLLVMSSIHRQEKKGHDEDQIRNAESVISAARQLLEQQINLVRDSAGSRVEPGPTEAARPLPRHGLGDIAEEAG